MRKRYITYDLHNGSDNNYQNLYDFFKRYKAEKITESTYLVCSDLTQEKLNQELKQVTKKSDNVSVISCNNNEVFHWKIWE